MKNLKSIRNEFLRFLLVGMSNTLIAYAVFLLTLPFLPYLAAYTLSYCAGVVNSYFMNVLFVFRQKVSLGGFLKFPLIYIGQYLLGSLIMWLFVGKLSVPPVLAYVGVILITVPVTFIASRFVLKH